MKKQTRGTFLARSMVATTVAMRAPAAFAEDQASIPLRVAMSVVNYDAAPLYYAQRSGIFTRSGLSVSIERIASGAATVAAVASGTIDIGKATTMGVLSAFAHGVPLTIIAPAAQYDASAPDGSLVVAPDSPIKSVKDIEGKLYGTTSLFDIDHVGLLAYMDQRGADSSSVKVVEVPISAVGAAIAQHRVDTAFLTEPALSDAISAGKVKPLMPVLSGIGSHFLYSVWFTSSAFAKANPEAVRRFSSAMLGAQTYVNGHHLDVAPLVAELSNLPVSEIARVKLATCGTTLTPADLQPIIDAAAKYKALPKAFDARALINPGSLTK